MSKHENFDQIFSKHRPDNLEEILKRTVRDYLRRIPVKYQKNEEKAEYISHMCSVGGGTDTCNLITFYSDLEKAILDELNLIEFNCTIVGCREEKTIPGELR